MEKLDLKKFRDYKLDKKQLSYIHAGEGDTGGGMVQETSLLGYNVYSYGSDYINSSGALFYNNVEYCYSRDFGSQEQIYVDIHDANCPCFGGF